jgi:3-dehydroquinate dehydratase type I
MSLSLKILRQRIDKIDNKIIELLVKRKNTVLKIADTKKERGKAIEDEGREAKIAKKLEKLAKKYSINPIHLQHVFQQILIWSKDTQATHLIRVAVAITAKSTATALKQIKEAQKWGADLVELRIDYLKDLNPQNLKKLIKACKIPCIVTPRSTKEGGNWSKSEAERLQYLEKALEFGAEYIDIELSSGKKEIAQLHKLKGSSKIIVSYHDFQKTPSTAVLNRKLKSQIAAKADICKVVTMAKKTADCSAIYELIAAAKTAKQEIIAIGMGPLGQETRIRGPKMGAYLTFSALSAQKSSAPGQLTIRELKSY